MLDPLDLDLRRPFERPGIQAGTLRVFRQFQSLFLERCKMRSKICTIITLFTWSANNLLIWNTQFVSRMTLEAGSNNMMRPEEGMSGSLLVQENAQGTTEESGRAGGCKGQVFYQPHMLFILIIAADLRVNFRQGQELCHPHIILIVIIASQSTTFSRQGHRRQFLGCSPAPFLPPSLSST